MRMNIWKAFSIFCLVILSSGLNAQKLIEKYEIDSLTYLHKSFETKKKTINFLEVTKKIETTEKRDLIFFLQGSSPSPLISEDDNGKFLLLPFNLKKLSQENIFVIISKPNIPVYKHFESLDDDFKVDDKKILDQYIQSNTLEYLSDEVNVLVNKYCGNKRIRNIYVIGHSQGARVAINIRKKKVKKIAILSVNLLGRYEESINRLRYDEISKQENTLQDEIEKEYNSFKTLKHKNNFNNTYDDLSLKSYKSFTFPSSLDELEKTKIPMLIVYGTNDIGVSFSNDLIRLKLIDQDKENFSFKTYPLLNHNFERFNTTTKTNDNYWQKVLEETIVWLKK